ncbi:MAG TPA: iron-sulfur cluster assembly protein [Alphaproteobacteria bacterium]|nr:PaaD protein [Rhodospirillaceae bacterium]HRJ11681.1 iron-sulfur cluster assembly protein [Alphaproteobacteria bacterium]
MTRPVYTPEPETDETIAWDDPIITPANFHAPEGHPLVPQIVQALRRVYDPEIPVNLYELGLIYDLQFDKDGNADIKMTLTSPGCPVAHEMPGMVQNAIMNYAPDFKGDVNVEIVWEPQWTKEMMSDSAKAELGFF